MRVAKHIVLNERKELCDGRKWKYCRYSVTTFWDVVIADKIFFWSLYGVRLSPRGNLGLWGGDRGIILFCFKFNEGSSDLDLVPRLLLLERKAFFFFKESLIVFSLSRLWAAHSSYGLRTIYSLRFIELLRYMVWYGIYYYFIIISGGAACSGTCGDIILKWSDVWSIFTVFLFCFWCLCAFPLKGT